MRLIFSILVFCLAGCANTSNDNSTTEYFNPNEVDKQSKWIVKIDPKYPQDAFNKGIEGYVRFNAIITTDGKLENIVITESVPERVFDNEAISALKKWYFRPAVKGGKTVNTTYSDQLQWKLKQ
ncbi:energy transducer TonB [Alteromonas sp. 5E99-2]|uniref:energy transducer TonB n=1 Tax=Alteromonas sp. 5E99-2 TaxID=2817683 RepID=UPI001A986259|nr:energy transducer TonB [Alteromonas sp. 5E99-2]MBO1256477.1 energy transducer TonB [Alteromonas sp. 5E99-2]